jgi:hypothetical protein
VVGNVSCFRCRCRCRCRPFLQRTRSRSALAQFGQTADNDKDNDNDNDLWRSRLAGLRTIALLLVLVSTACTARRMEVTSSVLEGGTVNAASGMWTREELFFGLNIPTGGVVTDSAFDAFVEREVVSRFPDGFTLLPVTGYYQRTREPARVLLIFYREAESEKTRRVSEIAALYKRLFNQQSVLRVTSRVRATF